MTDVGILVGVVSTEHGRPAVGGLLDVFWSNRRDDAFDEACPGR